MGAGVSKASTQSTQTANADIAQQYAGTCDIECNNSMNNVTVSLVNTQVGGDVGISQSCSVNGQCLFNVSQNALADVLFKAANSTSAGNAGGWLNGLFNWDSSNTKSYQEINEDIQQSITETCNVSSTNQMNNVGIYAVNSQIGGDLFIDQTNTAQGGCTLQASMQATAMATATADNCSQTGKKAKKSCGGKGGKSIGTYLIYGVAAIVVFIIVMIIFRVIRNRAASKLTPQTLQGLAAASGLGPEALKKMAQNLGPLPPT